LTGVEGSNPNPLVGGVVGDLLNPHPPCPLVHAEVVPLRWWQVGEPREGG
jgi:hypothetical protein